jgi:hypothetical protein
VRGEHFGVVLGHRARHDDDVGFAEVGGRVTLADLRAERAQALGHRRELEIRAAHGVAEIQQHFGDAGHARAADADEMDRTDLAHPIVHP